MEDTDGFASHLAYQVPPRNFKTCLMSALEGLNGVLCIADDILVFGEGTTYQEAEKDHDRRLVALMERCSN